MRVFADYHTHTTFSGRLIKKHGKGSILQNAICAKAKGLREIAITDHGYNHFLYGTKRIHREHLRHEIEKAKKISGINVLMGIEANFISLDGEIDIIPNDLQELDILVLGHHRFVKAKSFKDWWRLFVCNMFGNKTQKQIDLNTNCVINALEKYPVNILAHLGYGMKVNVLDVAKQCVKKNTLIELNGKRINFTDEEIELMVEMGVKFVVNSDAHSPERVGVADNAISLIERLNIPYAQVVNFNTIVDFDKLKAKGRK